ncbi:MAG TPA: AIR synthase-related protein, partial [Devosia sp.]|nr:AIR synthase-related protein [Devosia sp.]
DKRGTHLGQSIYLRDLFDRRDGSAPPVDLAHERRTGDFVRQLIRSGVVTACHDLSDGGLGIALAEMAVASGIGAQIVDLEGQDPVLQYFGEDQGRYLVTVNLDPQGDAMLALWDQARQLGVFCPWIGTTGGTALTLGAARPVPVADLKAAHEGWFPGFMAGAAA